MGAPDLPPDPAEARRYLTARLKAFSKNHEFRYPKWRFKDAQMVAALIRESRSNSKRCEQ